MHTVFCRRKIVNSVPGHLHRGKAKQQGTDKARTGLFLPQVNGAEAEKISRSRPALLGIPGPILSPAQLGPNRTENDAH